jgi:hypothetical protein
LVEIQIKNNGLTYVPVISGNVVWTTERTGTAGKLTFTVVKDNIIDFQEGNPVTLKVDGKEVFYGYVFEKKRTKEPTISVTAYDQLRYLKNKDYFIMESHTASDLIRHIAEDFRLNCGEIEDTGYVRTTKNCEGTLFDIFQEALDDTLMNRKEIYVLYDDYGKLTLKNIKSMKIDDMQVITDSRLENIDYSTSIDGETYNRVRLVYEDKDSGTAKIYQSQSTDSMNKWGVLQYFEKANQTTGLKAKTDALLGLYNKKTRKLVLKGVFGDLRVRAGCMVPVLLNLGDIVTQQFFICEKVTHTFSENRDSMDLSLRGSDFIV